MKKRLLFSIVALSIIYTSCSKTAEVPKQTVATQEISLPVSDVAEFSGNRSATLPITFTYYTGETLHDWSGNDTNHAATLWVKQGTDFWTLSAARKTTVQGPDPWDRIEIGFKTENKVLYKKKYISSPDSWCQFWLDQGFTYSGGSKDSMELVISSIHDGLADGSFGYRSVDGSLRINSGEFKNVPIFSFLQ